MLAGVTVFILGVLLRQAQSGGDGGGEEPPEGTVSTVHAVLADRPEEAALAALATNRSNPSTEAELAMIDVAVDGKGLERVVDTGSEEVTAALVLERDLLTAGSDGSVQVWGREDGALLGEVEAGAPLVALADTEASSPFVAAIDRRGAVELVDLTDPRRPRLLPLGTALSTGEEPLAVAFSREPVEVVAVGAGGEILRVDATTGEIVSRTSLETIHGTLPWREDPDHLQLTAAKFVPEVYEDEEGLLVATSDGAVVDVDLGRGQGKTVLDAGFAPGRVLSVDRVPYVEPELVVGTSNGFVVPDEAEFGDELRIERGPPVTGVAIDFDEGFWRGGEEGVMLPEEEGRLSSGPAIRELSSGFHGIAAINPGGRVSVLGEAGSGISLDETEITPVAGFDPAGRLLIAEGYDANHIEEIRAVRPQPRLPGDEYQEEKVLETYRPDPDWWPEAEDPDALYLNDVVGDGEYVVAGGQDPNGEAAVMVWDSESGEPLHHLALGTGGLSTALPSIVAKVLLLPERNEIVAYSAAQELLAIWSTESWELEDSIPIGAVGDVSLSPDESTIVALGLGEDEEYTEPDEPIELTFVDVGRAEIDHEVELPGIVAAALSPDGNTLAVADQKGFLRFRSADGREQTAPPIDLAGGPETLAWRPDGKAVAVALADGGIVIADPESRDASEPLPHEGFQTVTGLSWSPDAGMLAALRAELEEEGEGYDPAPAEVWTLDSRSLQRRMCELAACRAQGDSPAGEFDDASRLDSVALVFRRDGDLLAAGEDGETARIGNLEQYPSPTPAFDWSDHGLAWSAPGQVSVLTPGAEAPRSWPCACSGVAWDGEEVLSLEMNGGALVRIDPERGALRTTPLQGVSPYSPTLLDVVGGAPIIATYEREPDRSTLSVLSWLDPNGVARKIATAHGSIYGHWPSASQGALAFVAGLSSGVCYSTAGVGIVSKGADGGFDVRYPASPLGEEASYVRSAQVAADGSISATFGLIGCDDGILEDEEPAAERYRLEGGRWQPTGEKGFDVQAAGAGAAVLEQSAERSIPGALSVVSGGERHELAPQAESLVGRP